jgi:Na+-translocating ferredoxin:NAD+ oxidoreductase RnfC subunit
LAKDFPFSKSEIVARILEGGVVGAGGAGFPTHIKANARADVVIANGCECEPLIQTDRHVLTRRPDEVLEGLRLMMLATGASRGYVAVREGQEDVVRALEKEIVKGEAIEVAAIADNYPAGDEHILVYELTGRVIAQGGIPPDVGVVVSNVNTLVNVKGALGGEPVVKRTVSVCGDVVHACVVDVPIGTRVGDVLRLTGNDAGLESKGILLSGVMMGVVCEDLTTPIDKRMGSIVVLPDDSEIMVRKSLPVKTIMRRAASVCCQCTLCTELCPRHLMGHDITPHKIMRAICWARPFAPDLAGALFCSGCGLCGVYVCPMLLSPDRISFLVRAEMAGKGIKVEREPSGQVVPVRAHRLVPHERIVERTGLGRYQKDLSYRGIIEPERVSIPLSQHTGVAARPSVKPGDIVRKGDLIACIEADEVGANVHSSIDGVVLSVNHTIEIEKR